jgi:signal transduction histidine kinase
VFSRLRRSLSLRLLGIFLVLGATFTYGTVLAIRWVYETDQMRELVSGHLALHLEYVRRDIGDPPQIARALTITEKVPVDIRISGPGLEWASDPRFPPLAALDFGDSGVFRAETSRWLDSLRDVEFANYQGHGFVKLQQGRYAVVVSSPKIGHVVDERPLAPAIVGFVLLLVALAYLAVLWLFRPIGAIREGALQFRLGQFEHRIAATRADELGELALDINRMAAEVQRMLDAKRQLLLGISHELRTPLSRMKLALVLAEDSAGTRGLGEDVREMEKIIGALLEAERLNARHEALHIERVHVRALVERLLADFFAADRERIRVSGPDDLDVDADEARVSLMLKNLLANALRHSPPEGLVRIDFDAAGAWWWIEVTDQGPGIPPEQVPLIGEPFHRGDPSRTRDTGGSGLGLYLARLIAVAHGGRLELDQAHTGGARFVVTLPVMPH